MTTQFFPPRSTHAFEPWRHGEPTLDQVLGDPVMTLLLARDGLTPEQVRRTMEAVRDRLCPQLELAA